VQNIGQLQSRERLSLDIDDGTIVEERHVTVGPEASKKRDVRRDQRQIGAG